jgi:hypothetical protein
MLITLAAIALLAGALGIGVYLIRLVWLAARPSIGTLFERRRIERYVAHAHLGDELLRRGELEPALAEFEAAFYPHVARDRAAAQAVVHHHTGLLSRLIAAADHVQDQRVRLMSLAKADRLLQERSVLQRRYVTLLQSGSRQRLREIDAQFRANTRELRAALASLSAEILSAKGAVRYH